jgi:hypothetical protein
MAAAPASRLAAMRVDHAIGMEVIVWLQPLGVEAALAAMEAHGRENQEKRRQV